MNLGQKCTKTFPSKTFYNSNTPLSDADATGDNPHRKVIHIRGGDQKKLRISKYPGRWKIGKISVGQSMGEGFVAMKDGQDST